MHQTSVTIEVSAPASKVWEALADFQNVYHFHPRVATVDQLSEPDRGLGAVRRCNFHDGTSVVERITRWEEGASLEVALSDFSMPLKTARGALSVRSTGEQSSAVTFTMYYTVKYGPLGWVMGALMMQPMMKGMFRQVLDGLEHYVLTGETAGEANGEKPEPSPA